MHFGDGRLLCTTSLVVSCRTCRRLFRHISIQQDLLCASRYGERFIQQHRTHIARFHFRTCTSRAQNTKLVQAITIASSSKQARHVTSHCVLTRQDNSCRVLSCGIWALIARLHLEHCGIPGKKSGENKSTPCSTSFRRFSCLPASARATIQVRSMVTFAIESSRGLATHNDLRT